MAFGKEMRSRIISLVILSIAAHATQVAASEYTASLAEKVRICDLVAIIRITSVEKGHFRVPLSGQPEDQDFNVKLTASITERIKGFSSDKIEIHARSSHATAGFNESKIAPGRSYIAYLQATVNGTYRLGWSSIQFLEVISDDGKSVNDIGQTHDQVRLAPKLRKLRALAAGGLPLALITDPVVLFIAFSIILLIGVFIIRKKQMNPCIQAYWKSNAEQIAVADRH